MKRGERCQPYCRLPAGHAYGCSPNKPKLKRNGHRFIVSWTGSWECRKCFMSTNGLHLPSHAEGLHLCPGRHEGLAAASKKRYRGDR